MLIRSQDNFKLVNFETINMLYISSDFRGSNTCTIQIEYGQITDELGEYSSQEKAIQVLDMIQENYSHFSRRYGADCQYDAVFKMPNDSEVKQ